MIQPERVRVLVDSAPVDGRYVLYWMQASQRAEFNHALGFAVRQANDRGKPIVVVFGLTDDFPEANLRHYAFMLQGLRETQRHLAQRGILLVVRRGRPDKVAVELADEADLVVMDRGYLRVQKQWRMEFVKAVRRRVVEVESDVVVPVETVSSKEEYSAATIRGKIWKHAERFLLPLRCTKAKRDSLGLRIDGLSLEHVDRLLAEMRIDRSVAPSKRFEGGAERAKSLLADFIAKKLNEYDRQRSDPGAECESHMSPYLHFGQISPVQIALQVRKARVRAEAKAAFLEELLVRRELSMNFVNYNPFYWRYSCLPGWARASLRRHRNDSREYIYTRAQLESGRTHDPYWNAAQLEMAATGKMHNYLRMYWGKKILEWCSSPEEAFKTALYLNNKYSLDGRDPNSFAGVAWCFGKHDRPWQERPIFGIVRYMSNAGLRRKFDMEAYVARVNGFART